MPLIRTLHWQVRLLLVLSAPWAWGQDVFSSGPKQPQPLETRRLCAAPDPGPYSVRNPPSCARAMADGERRFGVRASFVTLRESRQIPASWMFAAPTGPCAEGESMVFFTDAGMQLFARTRGQCDDVYGGQESPPTGTRRPSVGPPAPSRNATVTGTGSTGGARPPAGDSGDAGIPQTTGLPCIEPAPGERETVRGLPGGRSCELHNGDELWCRQRNAQTRNVWLPTNPAWPMKPVGVRVLDDCRIVALDNERGYWDGVNAGLVNCGLSATVMLQAFQALAAGQFEQAAQLMGATDSSAGLRGLWQEWTQVQVIDAQGQPLKQFDVGKRQAERVCMYVLLPKAQSCAISGTACATRGAMQACKVLVNRAAQLHKRIPVRLPKPPDAISRGLLLVDENYLKQLAVSEGKVIIVRDSNQWSMRWIGREGYAPKPMDIKGKTLKREDLVGVPDADRYVGLASAKGMSLEARAELLKKGYKIASPGDQEVIRGPDGPRGYYSDTDLHGVYNLDGSQGWSPALLEKLKCHFFERGVQHGPHDVWPSRNDRAVAGPNYGPQVGGKDGKALTAYLPDGSAVHVTTLEQMKALYRAIGVDWQALYPYH